MTSDSVKEEIIRLGGIKHLIELAIGDSEQQSVAAQSAKTLVMLGFVGKVLSTFYQWLNATSNVNTR
jgi:hypothetical protein